MSSQKIHRTRISLTNVLIILVGIVMPAFATAPVYQPIVSGSNFRRQDSPTPLLTPPLPTATTSTSSYDFWWPYPPASTVSPTMTPAAPDSEETSTEDLSSSFEDTALPTSDALSSLSTTSSTISALTSSTSSNTSTASGQNSTSAGPLFTITALPPLTSPSHGSHAVSAYHAPINPLIFAPIFGVLGCAIGVACGWWGYSYWKIRQQARNVERFNGPKYEGVNGDDEDTKSSVMSENLTKQDSGESNNEDVEEPHLYIDTPITSNHTGNAAILDTPMESKSESTWPRLGLSTFLRSPLVAGVINRRPSPGLEYHNGIKDRLSLLPAEVPASLNRGDVLAADDFRSPYPATVFSSVATSDEDGDEEDYEDARQSANLQGPVRQKSMRKRLAEKLQLQFSPRRGFSRQKSKQASKARGTTPELEEGILMRDDFEIVESPANRSSLRNKSKLGKGSSGHGRAISNFAVDAVEIQTPPKVYALTDPGVVGSAKGNALQSTRAYSTPLKSGGESDIDDRYTPLPARRSRSARKLVSVRSKRTKSETFMDDSDASPTRSLAAARHVLPSSPRLLSSPELESTLFFSSGAACRRPDMSRSLTYDDTDYFTSPHRETESPTCDSARRGPSGPRQANKLRSIHSPNVNTGANSQTQARNKALPASPPCRSSARSSSNSPTKARFGAQNRDLGRERSSTLPSSSVMTSPKERFQARRTALDKVDAIVGRSWSARQIQGIATPSSPTMFGAYADHNRGLRSARNYTGTMARENSPGMRGIEQAFGSP